MPAPTQLRARAESSTDGAAEIRARIQAAAGARFIRYGFAKTTMAEIAADCAMSAANIYRYFESKEAIAAAGTDQWLAALRDELAAIAEDVGVSAGERLRRLVRARLAALVGLIEAEPHLEELIEYICREREALIERHRASVGALVARILDDGQRRGEFRALDSAATAATVQAATRAFFHHAVIRDLPRARLEAEADAVVALIVDGLRP